MNKIMFPSGSRDGQLEALSMTSLAPSLGKTFVVSLSTGSNYSKFGRQMDTDRDGVVRLHATPTAALALCEAGRGDVVLIDPSYTTALTAAEILAAETKGVKVLTTDHGVVNRATAALPATTAEALFTVTGRVRIKSIIGVVTTVIQTQANNTKLVANPTVGADVDLCAVNNISADAVGTVYSITGTLADAMVATTSGVGVAQAAELVLEAGTIDLDCAATNTGSVKWRVEYEPVDPGARIIAA